MLAGNSNELITYKSNTNASLMGQMSPVGRMMTDDQISKVESDEELNQALIEVALRFKKRFDYEKKKFALGVKTKEQYNEMKKEIMSDTQLLGDIVDTFRLDRIPEEKPLTLQEVDDILMQFAISEEEQGEIDDYFRAQGTLNRYNVT